MQIAVSLAGAGAGAQYAMSDNVFDTNYTVSTTYSETDHRATFANAAAVTSVARLITGYGVAGQIRAIQFESVVKPAQRQIVGLCPSLTQGGTATPLVTVTNAVSYTSTGIVYVNNAQVATGLTTWGAGDKITAIYNVTAGTVEFWLNGTSIYTATGISGDMTPACEGENANTHEIRVSTSSSYTLTGGALYWR